jgi:hypothetical protein
MSRVYPVGGGAPGINPKILTALPGDVAKGKLAGVKDNYDPVMGTLELTGNAAANHVLAGETFYTNNLYTKQTGTMTVQSILSFSAAPYTESQLIFTWQNPWMGPFSGVIIVGKTGGYPSNVNDGTRYYQGFGNNGAAGGVSNAVIGNFQANVTYYFKAFGYTIMNGAEWVHANSWLANTIINLTVLTFTSSQTWTVPAGITEVKVFCVGGGGGGGDGSWDITNGTGSGGGGGYTVNQTINVTPGQQIPVIIGSGGASYLGSAYGIRRDGSPTSFGSIVAKGGYGGYANLLTHQPMPDPPPANPSSGYVYSDGGSGGGGGGPLEPDKRDHLYAFPWGAVGGSDGTNGGRSYLPNIIVTGTSGGENDYGYGDQVRQWCMEGGRGQGSSTRAFGDGTAYSGGGGGGGGGKWKFTSNGSQQEYNGSGGGAGQYGGGIGGTGSQYENSAQNAIPNTGGGGGGGSSRNSMNATRYAGSGGSGIVIVRYIG